MTDKIAVNPSFISSPPMVTFISFKNGKALNPIKFLKKTKQSGTKINFLPSKDVFSNIKFNPAILQKKMRELAFLNKGLKINLVDETHAKTKNYEHKYDGGIAEFVTFLDQKKSLLINRNEKAAFKKPIYIKGEKNDVIVEI